MKGRGNGLLRLPYLYFLSFIVSVLGGALTPLIPVIGYRMGASGYEIGAIGSAGALLYIFLTLLSGSLSEKIGRKAMLLTSFISLACSTTIYAYSIIPLHLIFGRLLEGLSYSTFWPSLEALLTESHKSEARSITRLFTISWSSGMVLGALLYDTLLNIPRFTLFATLTVFSLVLCLATVVIVEEEAPLKIVHENIFKEFLNAIKNLKMAWTLSFSYAFVQALVFNFYPVLLDALAKPERWTSVMLSTMLMARTLSFGLLAHMFVKNIAGAVLGLFLSAMGGVLIQFTDSFLLILLGGFFLGTGAGLLYSTAFYKAISSSRLRGVYTGIFESTIGLGYFTGPLIGGVLAETNPLHPYSFISLYSLFLIVLVLSSNIHKRSPNPRRS